MSKLTSAERAALPKSAFVFPAKAPGSGSYPIPDKAHARNAAARATQNGSPAVIKAVHKKVNSHFPHLLKLLRGEK